MSGSRLFLLFWRDVVRRIFPSRPSSILPWGTMGLSNATLFTVSGLSPSSPQPSMGTKTARVFKQGLGQTSKAFSQAGQVSLRSIVYNAQGRVATPPPAGSVDRRV